MKNKHLLILFLMIITTCVFVWVFVSPLPDLEYVVNSPFGRRDGYYTIQPALYYRREPSLWHRVSTLTGLARTPAPTPLQKAPGQYSTTRYTFLNDTSHVVPVISSAVHSGNLQYAPELLQSVHYHVPALQVVIHDIGLRYYEKQQVSDLHETYTVNSA